MILSHLKGGGPWSHSPTKRGQAEAGSWVFYSITTSSVIRTSEPTWNTNSLLPQSRQPTSKARVDSLLASIHELLFPDNPQEQLNRLSYALEEVLQLAASKKYMNNRDLGKLESTPALKYRTEVA
jgi:hypothetical protein